jgi:hypothetical protein
MDHGILALRREKLIGWANQTISILDWAGLQQLAEFDPAYLNFSVEPRQSLSGAMHAAPTGSLASATSASPAAEANCERKR